MVNTTKLKHSLYILPKRARMALLLGSLLIAITAITFFTVSVPASHALPNKMVMNFYYTDINFTNEVGWQTVLRCLGTSGPLHGEIAEYVRQEEMSCGISNPAAGPIRCYRVIYNPVTNVIQDYFRISDSYCT